MILSLETATTACSAALSAVDGSVVAERVYLDGPAHAQRLLLGVHEVITEAGADWADIDVVAVGLGPGAFTGLRIGIATARALAQADGRARLAGVPTPAALALALAAEGGAGRLVPIIDGKRSEVFAAVYERAPGGGVQLVEPAAVVAAGELGDWLAGFGEVTAGGDGAALYAALLPPAAQLSSIAVPTAAMVGRAVACGAPGLVWGAGAVLPLYGRAPDAARWAAAPRSADTSLGQVR